MKKAVWYKVHNKNLPVPSFFMIYNIGGGGADRTRSVVYMDLYKGIPQLYNYYYLKLRAKPAFDASTLKRLEEFDDFSCFIKFMRETLIEQHKYSEKHEFKPVDYGKTVYLLDSGAKNILNDIVEANVSSIDNEGIIDKYLDEMKDYYDFADRHRFDLVISFDTGGKYTFKDGEKKNQRLIAFEQYLSANKESINIRILKETIKYLKEHHDYYPCVLATIHGNTPKEYEKYVREVIDLEKKYDYKFWGFALGGIASSKGIDPSWMKDYEKNKAPSKNAYVSALATKIVRSVVGDRPIHPLGAGGYDSIDSLYDNGATSFDSNSPNRRAGDGAVEEAHKIMMPSFAGKSVSKYLVGKVDSKMEPINPELEQAYKRINELLSTIQLCGCPACSEVTSIQKIKELYAKGANNTEDFYLSRQLICAHSTWQHYYMCMKYWYDSED